MPTFGGQSPGGMFGGVLTSIVAGFVLDALLSEPAAPDAQPTAQITPARIDAFQKAVEQQRRVQEERQSQLLTKMIDVSASRIADSTTDMTILESLAVESGRVFDGGITVDPHSSWMAYHDAWFSTEVIRGVTQTTGAQPLPIGDQPLNYSQDNFETIQCLEKLCPFPNMKGPVMKLETISIPPPSSPPAPQVVPTNQPTLVSQWTEIENNIVWAARQRFDEIVTTAKDERTGVEMLTFVNVYIGKQTLPGLQQRIASESMNIYRRIMDKVSDETFEVLTAAFAGRWEEALERSDSIGEKIREEYPCYKMVRLSLEKDFEGVVKEVKGKLIDYAKDVVKERIKDWLNPFEKPEWLKIGAKGVIDTGEHWLKTILKPWTP